MVTVSKQQQNGLAAPLAAPGEKSNLAPPRITRWFDVPDYPGYRVKLWVNYPRGVKTAITDTITEIGEVMGRARALDEGADTAPLEKLADEKKAEIQGRMAAIVLEHNGWPDEDGLVLPQPSDPAFWDRLEQHLSNIVSQMAIEAPSQLPNSLLPTRRR
jgi:hypothetical protein